ncbi:hypothetical protein [Zhongshania aliphaticivorans]|uniref:hypothetical protein n=1 Tax=Zhongshania aliphaticivorans TaxID=1470434 RepID=UPI0012E4F1EA|nr:hypothetical protein [Zhongshania aliphaticivorans]CAA0120409.1 Uncharacterised protein [Zhongshania aliphaticivorans]
MNIEEAMQREMKIFQKEISKASDSIYGVLISHLYIDHLLDRIIIASTVNDSGLTGKGGLSFSSKIKLAFALSGIAPQLADSLNKLNSIRNDCAHEFGHEISQEKIDKLGRTLGSDYKRILDEHPKIGVAAVAPFAWHICGQMLHATLHQEGCE